MHVFERWLRVHFGATPPAGYCLRTDHQERWLRLHSLPESKRYAEDDAERAEVRRRAWAAASELLPTGGRVWLVTSWFRGDRPGFDELPSLQFEPAGRYEHSLFEEPHAFFAAQTKWPHEGFEQLIDAIARDEIRVAWFSATRREVFAPYDGGIDLVVQSPARVEALRRVFPADWFSKYPGGL